ncbi:STAS domain-containing protein [Streptomyces sp. NPDC102467]|uniref:STAS domain-containing protein n=1 Tax=Streptomyces sp. NPDC102467 TaxID=3366179 RepID=UPI0038125A98
MTEPHARYPSAGEGGTRAAELRFRPLTSRTGLHVAGEICLPTHPAWERALERVVQRQDGDAYLLELSAVTFVDMAGTEALAFAAQRLDRGRRLVLVRPPASLSRLLELFWPDLPAIEVAAA